MDALDADARRVPDLKPMILEDKYTVEEGVVYLTGIQALARLPMDQARRDRRAGLNTGILISGYEGSPLGGYDLTLAALRHLLDPLNIVHIPGLNEELAAASIMGSQMVHHYPRPKVDGVTGIWYGKSPGVDRSGDVFRHGNLGGGGPHSGTIVLGGDDPSSKSSTVPNQSDYAFVNVGMPILYPASVAEFLELGLHAIAMSRFTGLWIGFKAITNLCDGGSTVRVSPDSPAITIPEVTFDDRPFQKADNFLFVPTYSVEMERHLYYERHRAAQAYARANRLDRIEESTPKDRIGIVAAGKTYGDVRQALLDMGLGSRDLKRMGVRLLRLALTYPIEPEIVRQFAHGLLEIIVVEEKRDLLESQIKAILYGLAERPTLVGKYDEDGRALFPLHGEMDADLVAEKLGPRLLELEHRESVARRLEQIRSIRERAYDRHPIRMPSYCSGCPHNQSTLAVEGELVGGGIGCHGMAGMMSDEVRQVNYLAPMGSDGAPYIGIAPFSETPHFFQNVGDGTFFHSASQVVRACVAADVDITFKLLYNHVVAMTGGQESEGAMDVPSLTQLLEVEGVRRVIIVADEPGQYRRFHGLARIAKVYPRERYAEAVKELAAQPGVSVLIYDQRCANEKRRLRKRDKLEDPNRFIVINEDVCEGCGDCGEVSSCLSVRPVETEFGRKTRIHQSSCNKDYSCLSGDCPSFLVVETKPGTTLAEKRPPSLEADAVHEPGDKVQLEHTYRIYIPGVGGTGVVTVNALLAYAAAMEGIDMMNLDQTGLAQKGGSVLSSLILTRRPEQMQASNRVGMGKADLYLALDTLVALNPVNLDRAGPGETVAVVNSTGTPTGDMIRHVDLAMPPEAELCGALDRYSDPARNTHVEGGMIAEALFGDHMLTNLFMLGVAYQAGLIPLRAESIEAAIALNGVAVEKNVQSFRYGRLYRHDSARVLALVRPEVRTFEEQRTQTLDRLGRDSREGRAYAALLERCAHLDREAQRLLAIRIGALIEYQDPGYAERYVDTVLETAAHEERATPERGELTAAVVRYLYKLMAYKDEYEVARLHLRGSWRNHIRASFAAPRKVKFALHPALLRALGVKRKVLLGGWFRWVLGLLVRMRRLRGTRLDPFGHTEVRREERRLIEWYHEALEQVLAHLTPETHDLAVEIATAPDGIRGYEAIKLRNATRVREQVAVQLSRMAGG